jgi:hypothetical protein
LNNFEFSLILYTRRFEAFQGEVVCGMPPGRFPESARFLKVLKKFEKTEIFEQFQIFSYIIERASGDGCRF